MKKLKRSSSNKVLAGIFGGLGEYMDIDPTILRLIGLLLFLFTGIIPFVIVYIIAFLIIPKTEEQIKKDAQTPAWKKWWFWIIILFIIIFLTSIIALLAVRRIDPNVDMQGNRISEDSQEAHEMIIEKQEPEREEIVNYLGEEIIKPNHNGKTFADYYRFGRDADKLYVWAYISEYYLENEEVKVGSAASLPLALEFENGKVVTHIQPRDGSDYSSDIKKIFPSHIVDKVLNIQKQAVLSSENEYEDLITHLEESTKEMAEDYFNKQEEEKN